MTTSTATLARSRATRNGPPTDAQHHLDASTYDGMWRTQRDVFLNEKRGSDLLTAPPGVMGGPMIIPRTTNADVLQLATYWTKVVTTIDAYRIMGRYANMIGYDGAKARWAAALENVDAHAKGAPPGAVYPFNEQIWRASGDLATTIAVIDEAPSADDLMIASVKSAVVQLPANVEKAASAVSHAVGSAAGAMAHLAGEVAHEFGSGLFGSLGVPLLLGGGALVLLFVLTRSGGHDDHQEPPS